MTSNHSDEHVQELIQHGIFHPEDLAVNRAHHLSERQKRRLYWRLAFWGSLAALDLAVLIPFLLTRSGAMIVFGMILVLGLAYPCYAEALPIWNDLQKDTPKSIAGSAHKKYKFKRISKGQLRTAFCSIQVGREVFSISPATYDRLCDDGFYRIYYTEHTKTILNIEPL